MQYFNEGEFVFIRQGQRHLGKDENMQLVSDWLLTRNTVSKAGKNRASDYP